MHSRGESLHVPDSGVESRLVGSALDGRGAERLLDLGCGSGRLSPSLRRLSVRYIGADPDASRLRTARARLGADTGVDWVRADANRLPFRDATLSAVVMVRTYHRIAHPSPMLAGVLPTLEPGGRLVLAVMPKPSLATLAYELWGRLSGPGGGPPLTFSRDRRIEVAFGRNAGFVETLRLTHERLKETGYRVVRELGCGFEEFPLLRSLPARLWVRWSEALRRPLFFPTVVILAERDSREDRKTSPGSATGPPRTPSRSR